MVVRNTMADLCTHTEIKYVGTSTSRLEVHNLQNFEIVHFLFPRENNDFPKI